MCVNLVTTRWILKARGRHAFLKVLSLDFIFSSGFSSGCMFSVDLAEEWIFFFDVLVHVPSCQDSFIWDQQFSCPRERIWLMRGLHATMFVLSG